MSEERRLTQIRERWSKVRYDCGAADENAYADDVGYLLSLPYARIQPADYQQEETTEQLWINPIAGMVAHHKAGSAFQLYARVHQIDDARVEEIEQWVDRHTMRNSNAYADLSRAFSEIRYLLSLLPQLSSSEPEAGGEAGCDKCCGHNPKFKDDNRKCWYNVNGSPCGHRCGWVTIGTIHVDIENETETFTREPVSSSERRGSDVG